MKPLLVIVFGLPGSGKTYYATRLAKHLGIEYLGTDQLRRQITINPTYNEEEKANIYHVLYELVCKYLQSNQSCVVDGTFYKSKYRRKFNHLVQIYNCKLVWIEIRADEAVMKKRLSRKREDSDAYYPIYELIKGEFDAMLDPHLILYSTENNIDEMIRETLF